MNRQDADAFAEQFGTTATIVGDEAPTALLSNAGRAIALFGPPAVPVSTLVAWQADWLARGMPTLGYAVGGVPDAVEHGSTGALVAPDDAAALADAVLAWLARPREATAAACLAFAARNGWDTFEARLIEALA